MSLKEVPQSCLGIAIPVGIQATPVELLRLVAPRERALDQTFQPRYDSVHVTDNTKLDWSAASVATQGSGAKLGRGTSKTCCRAAASFDQRARSRGRGFPLDSCVPATPSRGVHTHAATLRKNLRGGINMNGPRTKDERRKMNAG